MPPVSRQTTQDALQSLENAIKRNPGKVNLPPRLEERLATLILDESGRELSPEDMPLAYLALVSEGKIAEIRELEHETGIKAATSAFGEALRARVAGVGYLAILEYYAANSNFLYIDGLISDFEITALVTGIAPMQEITEGVLLSISQMEEPSKVTRAVRNYAKRWQTVPSQRVAMLLYTATSTPSKASSTKRVIELYYLLGKPPLPNGMQSPEELASSFVKPKGIMPFSSKNAFLNDLKEHVMYWKDKELPSYVASNTVEYLRMAIAARIEIPPEISEALPRLLILPLVNSQSGQHYTEIISSVNSLAARGLFTVDEKSFEAIIAQSLETLASLPKPASTYMHKDFSTARRDILEVSRGLGIPLTGDATAHLRRINESLGRSYARTRW